MTSAQHLTPVPDQPSAAGPASIQGEALNARRDHYYADLGFVDQYAREIEGTGLDICRERFRHRYPPIPRSKPFDRVTATGLLVHETEPCLDCGCAYQVQRYEPYVVGKGRNRQTRVRPAYNTTSYVIREDGLQYTTADHGFVRPADYRDAVATSAISADPEAQAEVAAALKTRTAVLKRREEREHE